MPVSKNLMFTNFPEEIRQAGPAGFLSVKVIIKNIKNYWMNLLVRLILIAQFVFQQLLGGNGHVHFLVVIIEDAVSLPGILNLGIGIRKAHSLRIVMDDVVFDEA
jgi:hypothetical protein